MTAYKDLVTRVIGVAALCGRETPCRADADEDVLTLRDRPDGSRLVRDDGSMGDAMVYAGEVWVTIGTLPSDEQAADDDARDQRRLEVAREVGDRMSRIRDDWADMDSDDRASWLAAIMEEYE